MKRIKNIGTVLTALLVTLSMTPGAFAATDTAIVQMDISSSLALDCGATVTMGDITGYGFSNLSTNVLNCNVITNSSSGYTMSIKSDTETTMQDTATDTIAAIAVTPAAWNVADSASGWGMRLSDTSTDDNTTTWGVDDCTLVDYGTTCKWAGTALTDLQLIDTTTETIPAGSDQKIMFGAEVDDTKTQPTGDYHNDITITAVAS